MVYIDDIRLLLCRVDVRLLAMLSLAWLNRAEDQTEGWVSKDLLCQPSILTAKYLYVLRLNILTALPSEYADWPVWENDKQGGYRISMASDKISFNSINVNALEYSDLTELMTAQCSAR